MDKEQNKKKPPMAHFSFDGGGDEMSSAMVVMVIVCLAYLQKKSLVSKIMIKTYQGLETQMCLEPLLVVAVAVSYYGGGHLCSLSV